MVGNARPFTPPPDEPPPALPAPAPGLPPNDGLPGDDRAAAPPGPPPKVDEKEHAFRAGARVAPAAASRDEREWRGLPSQWEQRKSRLAGRHLKAAELEAQLRARKAEAKRRASAAVLRSSVDAEAARARGDGAEAAAADAQRAADEEQLFREMASARRAAAAAAPSRGGGAGPRGLSKAHPLHLQREGLRGAATGIPASAKQDVGEAHPHFRQALRAQGLAQQADAAVSEARTLGGVHSARSKPTVETATPSRPRADMLRQCKAEVEMGAEETRYAVRAAARRAQPAWHREAHVLAARCEAKPLPKRRDSVAGSGGGGGKKTTATRETAGGQQPRKSHGKSKSKSRPASAPAVAQANGRWPMASADGRWRPVAAGAAPPPPPAPASSAGSGGGGSSLLPEILVFSLDETLWEGEVWLRSTGPPYTPPPAAAEDSSANRGSSGGGGGGGQPQPRSPPQLGVVVDSDGNEFKLRRDAMRILREVSSVWPQVRYLT